MAKEESKFEPQITIAEAVKNIDERKYLLPAIQREFIWTPKLIINLFDSILRGYPISSFLFWDVKGKPIGEYKFYYFLDEYHARDKKHNTPARVNPGQNITVILDG